MLLGAYITKKVLMNTPMEVIIPEIEEIVNFYTPESVEEMARETRFLQRESKLDRIEFLRAIIKGLYVRSDASLRAHPKILFRYGLRLLN